METTRIDFIMLAADETQSKDDELGATTTGGKQKPFPGPTNPRARGGWKFTQYAVLDNWVEEGDHDGFEGRWSDHRAVKVTIEAE